MSPAPVRADPTPGRLTSRVPPVAPAAGVPGRPAQRRGRGPSEAGVLPGFIWRRWAAVARWAHPGLTWLKQRWATVQRVCHPLWVKAKPVLAVVRPAGWTVLAIGLTALILGRVLHWHEFLIVAIALGVLLVGAVVFVLGRSTYAVNLDLTRERVVVGADAFGGLTVTNTSSRPLLSSLFLMPVGKTVSAIHVPRLAGNETFEQTFQLDTSKRAVVDLGPIQSSRGDGLGLLRRDLTWTGVQQVYIHPTTISLRDSSAGFLKDLEGRPTDTLSSSDIAFHALRDYVSGDDLRHVHWKSSARTGKLLVRQFEETRRSHLVICLSLTAADYLNEADFELAVSVAASLGVQSIRDEKDITVQVPGRRLRVQTVTRLLDDFARLEFGGVVDPLETLATDAAAAALDASVVVLLSGPPVGPDRLHAAMSRFGVDVLKVAFRCERGTQLRRAAIGSSPVIALGDLADLPKALRSLEV